MKKNQYKAHDQNSPGLIGHLLLILLMLSHIIFNEISGFFFQNILYGYSFIFYFILFFVTVQHYILTITQISGMDTETGETSGVLGLNKTRPYQLSSLVYRIEPQAACIALTVCWFLQIYLLKKPAPYPAALPVYPELFSVISGLLSIVTFIFFRYIGAVSKQIDCKEMSAILPYLAAAVILSAANAISIILSRYGFSWAIPGVKIAVIICNFIILFEYSIPPPAGEKGPQLRTHGGKPVRD